MTPGQSGEEDHEGRACSVLVPAIPCVASGCVVRLMFPMQITPITSRRPLRLGEKSIALSFTEWFCDRII